MAIKHRILAAQTIKGYKLKLEYDGGNERSMPAYITRLIKDDWTMDQLGEFLERRNDAIFGSSNIVLNLHGKEYYLVDGKWEDM